MSIIEKKYLDEAGLAHLVEKIKDYVRDRAEPVNLGYADISGASASWSLSAEQLAAFKNPDISCYIGDTEESSHYRVYLDPIQTVDGIVTMRVSTLPSVTVGYVLIGTVDDGTYMLTITKITVRALDNDTIDSICV